MLLLIDKALRYITCICQQEYNYYSKQLRKWVLYNSGLGQSIGLIILVSRWLFERARDAISYTASV
ncbi:hypothetical protein BJV82DRAFT_609762 [Fennellomyces sp. T-0311]|nr:hypothetical protein BJV82DRAFT_609762 [Fennellomyces sp. T-0311]